MNREENTFDETQADNEADGRLIHTLLLHLHDPQAAANREQRVQRLMEQLRQPACGDHFRLVTATERAARLRHWPVWVRRTVAIAALLLIAVGIWVTLYTPTPAMGAIADILGSLARAGDRTYHIQMTDLPQTPMSRPPDNSAHLPKPGLDDATLYLRNGTQYLLVRHDPNSAEPIFDGYDGQHRWSMHRGILDQTPAGRGGIPMPAVMADVPFSDLRQTLEQIRVDYKIEHLDQTRLSSAGELLRHVRVRRNSQAVKGPETIDIWADTKTAVPRRIIFDNAKIQGNPAPCRMVLDLVDENPLAPDWFDPAAHN